MRNDSASTLMPSKKLALSTGSLTVSDYLSSSLQIVMVNTTLPANSSAARAMHTMGLSRLDRC